jgi:DNA (cytosine-5)-methyltransferase 1
MTALDIFAGAGGFSLGAEQAGAKVLFAVNHYPAAVRVHHENTKKHTANLLSDAFEFDWHDAPDVDMVLASPACQGHSSAATRHGVTAAPRHDALRATAWAVPRCMEVKTPKWVIVENVQRPGQPKGFLKWDGFPAWKLYMENAGKSQGYGYHVSVQLVNCADFGVPQERWRAIIIAVRKDVSRVPFDLKIPKRKKYVGFGKCIDKNVPESAWTPYSRSAKGVKAMIDSAKTYLPKAKLMIAQNVTTGCRPRLPSEPVRTITTQAGQWKLVRKKGREHEHRDWTGKEYLCGMGFPKNYKMPVNKSDSVLLLGNAIPPPLAKEIVKQILKRG